MKRLLYLAMSVMVVMLTAGSGWVSAQTTNCSSGFNTTSGACGISVNGGAADFWIANHPTTILSGSSAILAPAFSGHTGNSMIKQTKVNNQAFSSTFTFVPNGLNVSFVLENQTNQSGQIFSSGAGGEGGFSQFAGGTNIAPNNVFALELDSYNPLTDSSSFAFSSAQIYQTLQEADPVQNITGYLAEYSTSKISTAPVALNAPFNVPGTSTGHTYSATITYDRYNLTLNLFDVTSGGSCPGANCFTHTWNGVYIPEITGATTSWVGLVAGTSGYNGGSPYPLLIKSFTYTPGTPSGNPNYTPWNANSTYSIPTTSAASPVYSIAPGSYGGTQSVAISTSTGPHNYICYLLSPTTPAVYPYPDNNGGCTAGTLYTGPVAITSTSTLYAVAGSNNSAFPLGSANPPGLGPPSTLVAGTYIIGSAASPTAATPSFSPAGGTFTSTQAVSLSDTNANATIYYTTNGSTPSVSSNRYIGPVILDSSATIKAIAVAAGLDDSAAASASYIVSAPGTPLLPPTTVATPRFSPAAGTYTSSQAVTIADSTSDATIYYTRDGSTPTLSSNIYGGPVLVSSTETLKAIAIAAQDTNSAVASAAYSISTSTSPAVINFADGFSNSSGAIRAAGSAYYSGSTIQLTSLMGGSASIAYFATPVNVQAFNTTFTWTAKCPNAGSGVSCGNGMGFAIASLNSKSSSNYKSGGLGGFVSWAFACLSTGICQPSNAVLVKFNLDNNQTGASGANLTGYYTGAQSTQMQQTQYDMAPAGINMQSGHLMRATLTYDGHTLYETVSDTTTGATYKKQYTTNIPALLGGNTAIVGFAGGTGEGQVQQNINSWTYIAE